MAFQSLLPNLSTIDRSRAVVERIIGTWAIRAQSSDQSTSVTMGIVMVDTDAFNAAALPEPELDDSPWLFHSSIVTYTGNILDTGSQYLVREIDVHSRRRHLGEHSVLTAIEENTLAAGADVIYSLRILLRMG